MPTAYINLTEIARQNMIDKGFIPESPQTVLDQLKTLNAPASPIQPFRDMRDLPFFSIDNDDSKDLDQLTYAEKDRIFIAVADVDALVKKNTPIDTVAANNTTSVYTPTQVFPMLPLKLSTNLTSLNPQQDRCAMVVEVKVSEKGEFTYGGIYPAFVRNHAQLAYNSVEAWFSQNTPLNQPQNILDQLLLQEGLARKIEAYRNSKGALVFDSRELKAVLVNDIPVGLKPVVPNRATKLIENFMIAANVIVTTFLSQNNLPAIRRIVHIPQRWDRIVLLAKEHGFPLPEEPDSLALQKFLAERKAEDPENFPELSLTMIKLIGKGEYAAIFPGEESIGHFDLALTDYAHTTAPNRRFPDVIMQRILKSHFYGGTPYTPQELNELARHCTEKEDDATKVERKMIKCAAAVILAPSVGKVFKGIITGASERGTWVRLFNPSVEGKVVKGFKGLDVGDKVQVKLIHVDAAEGFIDFQRINN